MPSCSVGDRSDAQCPFASDEENLMSVEPEAMSRTVPPIRDANTVLGDSNARRMDQVFDTPAIAAEKLGVAPQALRARCRRAARRCGGAAVAPLGGGIVAFKFGRSWRIRLPNL